MRLSPSLTMAAAVAVLTTPVLSRSAPPAIHADARAFQPGEVVEITVTSPPDDEVRVSALGHAVPMFRLTSTSWRGLLGLDLDVAVGAHAIVAETGPVDHPSRATYRMLIKTKAFPTRRLTVAEAFVNPPEDVQERIATEAKRLTALWESVTPERRWTGPFIRPVPDPANSAFGSRSILNGQARSPHGGADFLSEAGTPIHAPNDGLVVLTGDLYYTGNTVVIDHGLGLLSLFAHLSRIDVKEGQALKAGDVVGLVGATGRVTGPHLHWTVRLGGARVDPLSLLAIEGKK
jgi:murein DD-endopeptidase MepM/ murein hydrolase activator NlpD